MRDAAFSAVRPAVLPALNSPFPPSSAAPAGVTWGDHGTGITLSGDDLVASTQDGNFLYAVRSSTSHNSGKWYGEITIFDYAGNQASDLKVGVCEAAFAVTNEGAELSGSLEETSFGMDNASLGANNNTTIGVCYNATTAQGWLIRPDDTVEGGGDPEAGTDPTFILSTPGAAAFLAASLYGEASATPTSATLNAGASPFVRSAKPASFNAWDGS